MWFFFNTLNIFVKVTHWWANCSFSFSLYFSVWTCNLPIWLFSGHLGSLYSSWLLTNNAVTNVLVCISWWIHTHTHTHTHTFISTAYQASEKNYWITHTRMCILVFIASFPNVLSTLCNQTTHQLFFHILANVCQRYYEQRQKDNQYLWKYFSGNTYTI